MSRNGLFVPDERCVGGALETAAEYRHYFSAKNSTTSPAVGQPAQGPSAQLLSVQRAVKRASSNTAAHEHLVRLSHMYHRVALSTNRHPQLYEGRQQHKVRPCSVAADLCPWLPRCSDSGYQKRPSLAPEQHSNSRSTTCSSGSSLTNPSYAQHRTDGSTSTPPKDWQQLKAAAHPEPKPPLDPVQLPASRFYLGPNLLPSVQHRLFKASLMADILQRQLYRAADIQRLCVEFVQRNPPEHRGMLRQVVADVLQELDLPPPLQQQM